MLRKHIYALLTLTILLALLLTGCGQDAAAGTEPSAEAGETAPASSQQGEGRFGVLSGNTYSNSFFGIGWTLDDSWTYYNQTQLLELSGIAADSVQDEELEELLEESSTVFDMYAYKNDGTASINVVIERIDAAQSMLYTESAYVDLSAEQLQESMKSMGMANVEVETGLEAVAGQKHVGLFLQGEYNDVGFYERLVCIKSGVYIASVTVASYGEDTTRELLALIQEA